MQNTSNVGSVVPDGLQKGPVLERLRPWQIATLLLPGTDVQIIDATDEQFQVFVTGHELNIADDENDAWSFDDRVRFINHFRKRGWDLFAPTRRNNSPTIPDAELFLGHAAPLQALANVPDDELIASIGSVCDSVVAKNKKSSERE